MTGSWREATAQINDILINIRQNKTMMFDGVFFIDINWQGSKIIINRPLNHNVRKYTKGSTSWNLPQPYRDHLGHDTGVQVE